MDFLPPGLIASGPHNKVWRLRLQQQRRLAGLSPEPSRSIVASFRGLGELTPAQQAFLDLTPAQRAAAAQQKAIFGAAPSDAPSFPWVTVGLVFLTVAIVGYGVSRT